MSDEPSITPPSTSPDDLGIKDYLHQIVRPKSAEIINKLYRASQKLHGNEMPDELPPVQEMDSALKDQVHNLGNILSRSNTLLSYMGRAMEKKGLTRADIPAFFEATLARQDQIGAARAPQTPLQDADEQMARSAMRNALGIGKSFTGRAEKSKWREL